MSPGSSGHFSPGYIRGTDNFSKLLLGLFKGSVDARCDIRMQHFDYLRIIDHDHMCNDHLASPPHHFRITVMDDGRVNEAKLGM